MSVGIFIAYFTSCYITILLLWARYCPRDSKITALAFINLFAYASLLLYFQSGFSLICIYILLFIGYNLHRYFGKFIILFPLLGLLTIQYLIPYFTGKSCNLDIFTKLPDEYLTLGLSYICFRMLLFSFENPRTNSSLSHYLAYTLFLPSCLVGPISNSNLFLKSIQESNHKIKVEWALIERIMWGFLKASLISGIFDRISYQGIIFDGNSHSAWALPLASVGFYLYLYFNFSGVCDIVISISAICGIHLDENFNSPLLATNLSDFWRRWHITLGRLFRNLVYAPLSLLGLRHSRWKNPFFWAGISNLVTFVAIGLWHGIAWKWVVFGLMHGIGICVHSGFIAFKNRLLQNHGTLIQLFDSKIYTFASWLMTQFYVAASMIFFANELSRLYSLRTILVW